MTLVSYKHNFIYLKTRKTAGTSVEMFLQPYCVSLRRDVTEFQPCAVFSRDGIAGRRQENFKLSWHHNARNLVNSWRRGGDWRPHMPAREVRKGVSREFWDGAIKISSVRNPFNRLISSFYWAQSKHGDASQSWDEQIGRFRQRVRKWSFKTDRPIVFLDGNFVPNHLIRQEHIAQDLEALCKDLGLDPSVSQIPVTKKSKSSSAGQRPSTAEFYDEETADIVRDRFSWAFEHAGYPLEVPQ